MKERPILFNAPMVRAILDGSKTQTRRVVKGQYNNGNWSVKPAINPRFYGHTHDWYLNDAPNPCAAIKCPYGVVGDQLWVRETWGNVSHTFNEYYEMIDWIPDRPATAIHEMKFGRGYYSGFAIYKADGEFYWADDNGGGDETTAWHPSIHMPRLASRIQLEITSIRVERLQDISEADAMAEGIRPNWIGNNLTDWDPAEHGYLPHDTNDEGGVPGVDPYDDVWTAKRCYQRLWKSINGADSWASNPWVWVIEFKKIKP